MNTARRGIYSSDRKNFGVQFNNNNNNNNNNSITFHGWIFEVIISIKI